MADVSINSAIAAASARGMRVVVFSSASIGYWFYFNSTADFEVAKTTDGGASWTPLFEVDSDATITGVAFDVWFDKWTPGDSGTLIHICWFDDANDLVKYNTLDTSGDSLGTERTVFTGATAVAGYGTFVSVTKTRSGYLYCAYDLDAGAEMGLHRSTDAGVNWSASLDATFVEAANDHCMLFPASNTGDDNDCWAVYQDSSADALTLKMWDSSAGSATESATIQSMVETISDTVGQYGFSASVRHSDGHLIIASMSARDTAAADHQVFDVNGTGSITELTAINTNKDDHYDPRVFIDQNTNDIYVAYRGKRDGLETLGTTTKVYYTKSTDDGTSWSAGDTAYQEGAADAGLQVWVPLMGDLFYVGWRVGTTLVGNAVNAVDVSAVGGASVIPVLMNQYRRRRA